MSNSPGNPTGASDAAVRSATRAAAPDRLFAIDAMRGVAAMAVVFFHLQGAFARAPQPWMPSMLAELFAAGHYGVNIFFVLSGFVIAFSLRSANLSWRFVGQFTLRRSIRLDPPLWIAIVLEFVLVSLSLRFFPGDVRATVPTLPQMAANAVYLQEFLGYAHVSPVFWTLCFEIQFYLAFVILLVMARKIELATSARAATIVLAVVLAVLYATSLAVHNDWVTGVPRGLALQRWNEFFFGVLVCWTVSGRTPRWVMALAAAVLLASAIAGGHVTEVLITLSTAALCAASYLRPALNRLLDIRVMQWLGRISYSIYLYHGSFGYRTVSFGQHFLGKTLNGVTGPLLWLGSLAVAVGASAVLWWLVERPTLRLSRRIALTG